ncbi:hypothetical protein BB558_001062 [Smittium angustum]|uniref:Protein Zds1 C-terminal domain-containing protein n=1 Tax=Smittium angustum TaxID=133377 RepID=A0A2U1JCP2_SMIAN|nr:hypothetical protein BB558_001062 [Smittium angustum]
MSSNWLDLEINALGELKNDILNPHISDENPSHINELIPNISQIDSAESKNPETKNLIWLPARLHPEISPSEYSKWINKYGTQVNKLESSLTRRRSVLSPRKNSKDPDDFIFDSLKLNSTLQHNAPKNDVNTTNGTIVPFMVSKSHKPTLKRSKLLNKRRDSRAIRKAAEDTDLEKNQDSVFQSSNLADQKTAQNNSDRSMQENTHISKLSPNMEIKMDFTFNSAIDEPLNLELNPPLTQQSTLSIDNKKNTPHLLLPLNSGNKDIISEPIQKTETKINKEKILEENKNETPNPEKEKKKKKLFQSGISFWGIGKNSSKKETQNKKPIKEKQKPLEKKPNIKELKVAEESSNYGKIESDILEYISPTRPAVKNPSFFSNKPIKKNQLPVRYPLHIEREIYQMAGYKLQNPRRPLAQQVLLSNMMFWYLDLINPFKNNNLTIESNSQVQQNVKKDSSNANNNNNRNGGPNTGDIYQSSSYTDNAGINNQNETTNSKTKTDNDIGYLDNNFEFMSIGNDPYQNINLSSNTVNIIEVQKTESNMSNETMVNSDSVDWKLDNGSKLEENHSFSKVYPSDDNSSTNSIKIGHASLSPSKNAYSKYKKINRNEGFDGNVSSKNIIPEPYIISTDTSLDIAEKDNKSDDSDDDNVPLAMYQSNRNAFSSIA